MAKLASDAFVEPEEPQGNASREWFFDLVNSIANLLAIVNHLTEAIYGAEKAMQLGAKVVAMSDSSGYIYDPNGLNLDSLY